MQPKIAIINRHNSLLVPLQLHCITLGWLAGAQCVIKVQSVVVATNYHIISIKTISATEHITLCNKIIDVTIFSWTLTSLLVSPKSSAPHFPSSGERPTLRLCRCFGGVDCWGNKFARPKRIFYCIFPFHTLITDRPLEGQRLKMRIFSLFLVLVRYRRVCPARESEWKDEKRTVFGSRKIGQIRNEKW